MENYSDGKTGFRGGSTNMNGEVPSVPIVTLSGVSSLVDLLPEIQLPSPLPQTLSNKSLLFHPRVAEEAQRLLYTTDDNLVPQLVQCLSQTSSRHIHLKDQYSEASVEPHSSPALLSGILLRKPDVFNGKIEHGLDSSVQHHQTLPHLATQAKTDAVPQQVYTQLNLNDLNNAGGPGIEIGEQPPSIPPVESQRQHSTQHSHHGHVPSLDLVTNSSTQVLHNDVGRKSNQLQQVTLQTNIPNASVPNSNTHVSNQNTAQRHDVVAPDTNIIHQSPNNKSEPCRFAQYKSTPQQHHIQHPHLKPNTVDWNQVHNDLSKPQSYPVNCVSGGYQNPTIHREVSSICPVVRHSQPDCRLSRGPSTSSNDINMKALNAAVYAGAAGVANLVLNSNRCKQNQLDSQLKLPIKTETQTQKSSTEEPVRVAPQPIPSYSSRVASADTKVREQNPGNLRVQSQNHLPDSKVVMNKIQLSPVSPLNPEILKNDAPNRVNTSEGKDKRRRSSSMAFEMSDTRRSSQGTICADQEEDIPKAKIRRVERMLVPVLEKLSGSANKRGSGSGSLGFDSTTYHRFLKTMSFVLESSDPDFEREVEFDGETNVPPELLISRHQLLDLCAEAAKMKALGAMEAMPVDKLVELLKVLELNIREGCKVTPLADTEESEEESRLWLELTLESVQRGVSASLTALHILTSQNMPKKVYIEDLMDRIAQFAKFQLQNTIYPTFDPVYRIDPKGKDAFSSGKRKRAHAREVREKNMIAFYSKMHEVVSLLAELVNVQVLTDTTVLLLSTLGISPFFVENVPELQLAALKLVTNIFAKYEKHRRLLLDDILASIARLPSSKRSLRTFKLSSGSEECIQMLTALVLQLIQCVSCLPDRFGIRRESLKDQYENECNPQSNAERDVTICNKYDMAVRTGGTFISVFLAKCASKSEECDYRVLFENFIQDLLSTVNKPEWPAAELLLSLLGNILVKNLSNKSLEVSLRVSSLEYLGVAAARLRKDAVTARMKMNTIDRLILDIRAEEDEFSEFRNPEHAPGSIEAEEEKFEFLQRLLLDYLAVHAKEDPALLHSRHFLISNWWRNAQNDIAKAVGVKTLTPKKKPPKPTKKKKKRLDSEDESEDDSSDSTVLKTEDEVNAKILQMTERRKGFLLTRIRPFSDPMFGSRKTQVVQSYVDYSTAELITRYLASKRPFSASFDFFLTRILSVSSEQTVAIRTKSLRCLTMVVEADATVLGRSDMQMWVQNSFLDQSTAVREAAVDLVGKFVLSCPELIDKYYEILSLRILDTGVSVRKRVIKILRDICVDCPNFPKIPEICVKIIRRVNDEDGIRKLVMEVFQNMWFTPVKEDPLDSAALLRKVSHITDVVASCEKFALDFFEQLLLSLFKPKDDKEDIREKQMNQDPPRAVVTASTQIVNCLVEHVLRSEESSSMDELQTKRFIACVSTLLLFAKIRPQLLVNHAITLEAYLSMRCQTLAEITAVANIGNILELVVPLLVNPSESFLSQLEEDCVKLLIRTDKLVIGSCLACLGAVVNKLTKNYKLVREVFGRYHYMLTQQVAFLKVTPIDPRFEEKAPFLKRSVYTIGLFLRHFDFQKPEVHAELGPDVVNTVFQELLFLLKNSNIHLFCLQAIGSMCIRHYDLMLGNELKLIYQELLVSTSQIQLRVQTLSNLQLYLVEEELRMIKQDQEWTQNAKSHDIKEMGDVTSGMASTIVQIYLKQILEAFLHCDATVRLAAVRVVQLVLQQGLVHPIQIVPYLICMSTDDENGVGTTADKQIQEMEKKHPQFLQSQVLNGIRLSLQLQRILHGYEGSIIPTGLQYLSNDSRHSSVVENVEELPIVRGYRVRPKESPSALNGFLYSLLRSTKPQRRAISLSLLKQFDEQNKTRLADLLYYADNLAYFPYQVVDEPLFIIHHIDIVISVTGSNLLQAFKECLAPIHTQQSISISENTLLNPETGKLDFHDTSSLKVRILDGGIAAQNKTPLPDIMDDDEDESVEALMGRLPSTTKPLEEFVTGCQGCLLLLMLKQHLKDMYGLTEARISGYSPSDATKAFERPVNRKNVVQFEPRCTIANLKQPARGDTEESRRAMVEQYLHFKQLMLRIDPEDGEDEGDSKPVKIKIDQNLFTYSNAKMVSSQPSRKGTIENSVQPQLNSSTNSIRPNYTQHQPGHPSNFYTVVSQPQQSATPIAKVEPMVRVPKLTIVPLKFPVGAAGGDSPDGKKHKIKNKEHHHHHKHKKSKHKKKRRYAVVSDDDDSDNPDSDPDFRL